MTDSEITQLLREAVPEPPSTLSTEAVLRGARKRTAVRRLMAGAIGVVGVAGVAGVVVLALARPDAAGGSLADGSSPSPGASEGAAPTVPACLAAGLRVSASGGGVISNGFTGATVTLTNVGEQACGLAERITSLRTADPGKPVELPLEPVATDHGGPQDLAAGESAAFTIASVRASGGSAECGRPAPVEAAHPTALSFDLPGTGNLTVGLRSGSFTLGCWPISVNRMFLSVAGEGPPAPAAFRPTDVSFVSPSHGWAVSAGQVRRTLDAGRTWTALPGGPDDVDHIRFANDQIGYAWFTAGDLWATRDGGQTWSAGGLANVLELEASAGQVWAFAGEQPYPGVWRTATGGGPFVKLGTTPNRSGTLDVHGPVAYVVGDQGAGPIPPTLDVRRGQRVINRALPCVGRDVYVPDAPLGVSTDGSVLLVCDIQRSGDATQTVQQAFRSGDEGASWTAVPGPPEPATDVTATRGALFAWGNSLYVSRNGSWQASLPGSGFTTVGFQDDDHGIALGRDNVLHLTSDGGRTWSTARF